MENILLYLKNGNIITIGGKKDYTPTSFRYINNKLYYKNKAISGDIWVEHPSNLIEFKRHLQNMIDSNFKILLGGK